jgi:hypothetical protein
MLDKIVGTLRRDEDMPTRRVRNYACMIYATKSTDAYHDSIPGFPNQLDLWSEVTAANRFFDLNAPDPRPGGFTLVEIYDPAYWMNRNFTRNQPCFHPIYRMRAKNTLSALNGTSISLFVTKYAHIVPDADSGLEVAAPSFHFGFELWYFNRSQVDAIINTIFRKWQILAG